MSEQQSDKASLQALHDRMLGLREPQLQFGTMVGDVVFAVRDAMSSRLSSNEAGLLSEIGELGRIIEQTRSDVATCSVHEIRGRYLPTATDELDAIVQHTASATDSILESCEALDVVAAGLTGEPAEIMQAVTTKIYEACSFQDITGQRITKVIKALKAIEAKVVDLKRRCGIEDADGYVAAPEPGDNLLNGPGLPSEAMDQADIDKLLADF